MLVIAPHKSGERDALFLRPRDRMAEIWTGKRVGVEGAVADFGMNVAHPIEELAAKLPDYLEGARTLHYSLGANEPLDRIVMDLSLIHIW